jgi:hypothetical protein
MNVLQIFRAAAARTGGVVVVGCFLLAGPAPAVAAALLIPASSGDIRAANAAPADTRELPPQTKRHRLVRVDAAELARHVVPAGMDTAKDRAEKAEALDGIVTLELFPDVAATFHRTDVEALDDEGFAWTGDSKDKEFSTATLIIRGNRITGHVQLHRRIFSIDPVADGIHRVVELNESRFLRDIHIDAPVAADTRVGTDDEKASTPKAKTAIRLLAAYTARAQSQSANIVDRIKLGVKLANQAFTRGKIPARLVLTGTLRVVYNEGTSFGTNIRHVTCGLTSCNGVSFGSILQLVRTARNAQSADLVTLIRGSGGDACGIAWYLETPGPSTTAWGYSVVDHTCISNYVLAHEVGHNMGLHHDRFVESPAPASKYNYGYVNKNARIRTIMAYPNACPSCARINNFSSSTTFGPGGAIIGIRAGRPGAADNTRRLNETRNAISGYRRGSGGKSNAAPAAALTH